MEKTVYTLNQRFSIRSDFCLQGTSSMSGDICGQQYISRHFWLSQQGWGTEVERVGEVLLALECRGQECCQTSYNSQNCLPQKEKEKEEEEEEEKEKEENKDLSSPKYQQCLVEKLCLWLKKCLQEAYDEKAANMIQRTQDRFRT